MNETIRSITGRRSIRRYKPTPVDKPTIETLLKAGAAAPSAHNRQPWEFIVITERPILDQLANEHPYAKMLRQAPLCIIVCGNRDRFCSADEEEFWIQDTSAVTQNILVAAQSLGLGTVWCGVTPRPHIVQMVSRVVGLPRGIVPLCLIAVGYPDEDPPVKNKWRDERIHWNKW
jgi:nitroreductase